MLCFCCVFQKQNDTTESSEKHSAIYSEHNKTPDLNFFCADFDKKRIIYQNNCNYTVTYVYKITDTQKKNQAYFMDLFFSKNLRNSGGSKSFASNNLQNILKPIEASGCTDPWL